MTIKFPHNNNQILWSKKEFMYPKSTIRLATMFSGIGAVEFALKRLKLNSKIIFASDNDKFVKQSYFSNYNIDDNQWNLCNET